MLQGFRDGVREGTFQGKHLRDIALGLDFLERMIQQSKLQVEMAKRAEKEATSRAKEAITEAGGQLNAAS